MVCSGLHVHFLQHAFAGKAGKVLVLFTFDGSQLINLQWVCWLRRWAFKSCSTESRCLIPRSLTLSPSRPLIGRVVPESLDSFLFCKAAAVLLLLLLRLLASWNWIAGCHALDPEMVSSETVSLKLCVQRCLLTQSARVLGDDPSRPASSFSLTLC